MKGFAILVRSLCIVAGIVNAARGDVAWVNAMFGMAIILSLDINK